MTTSKQYANVTDMLQGMGADAPFIERVDEKIKGRELVTNLIVLRHRAKLTQAAVAEKMGVSQGCVSKLENSDDDSVRIGELKDYLSAVDSQANICLLPKTFNLVDQVKFHVSRVNYALNELAQIPNSDKSLGQGVSSFFAEALYNMIRCVESAHSRIRGVGKPAFTVCIVDADESPEAVSDETTAGDQVVCQ